MLQKRGKKGDSGVAVLSPLFFCRLMKYISKRKKVAGLWVTIYLEQISTGVWNLALIMNKSRRATNDWYWNRKNKRARRAKRQPSKGSLKHLREALRLVVAALKEVPENHHIYTEPQSIRSAALSRYIERLGFMPQKQDGLSFWVLTAQRRKEVQYRYEHTN